jgi:hypothetical protein
MSIASLYTQLYVETRRKMPAIAGFNAIYERVGGERWE